MSLPEYVRGDTVIVIGTVKDLDGNLVDPTSYLVFTYNPAGTIVTSGSAMVKDVTGKYHYDHQTLVSDQMGRWRVRHKVTVGARVVNEDDYFILQDLERQLQD